LTCEISLTTASLLHAAPLIAQHGVREILGQSRICLTKLLKALTATSASSFTVWAEAT